MFHNSLTIKELRGVNRCPRMERQSSQTSMDTASQISSFSLSPAQQQVVDHRGTDLQVIACAGSGKTESISRLVAALIAEGAQPASIVAFTFTERAAAELKERIARRVAERMGDPFRDRLGPMFVGTIHAYCFRILQDHAPKYGNYDVLDEHRHAGFLSREYWRLGLSKLKAKHWAPSLRCSYRDRRARARDRTSGVYEWLGVAGAPRFRDLRTTVATAVSSPPTGEALTVIRAVFDHLGRRLANEEALPTEISNLGSLSWLPAHGDDNSGGPRRTWPRSSAKTSLRHRLLFST